MTFVKFRENQYARKSLYFLSFLGHPEGQLT
jgi:hypothetical protein